MAFSRGLSHTPLASQLSSLTHLIHLTLIETQLSLSLLNPSYLVLHPDKCFPECGTQESLDTPQTNVFGSLYLHSYMFSRGSGNEHIKPMIAQRIFLRMRRCHGNQLYLDLVTQGWGKNHKCSMPSITNLQPCPLEADSRKHTNLEGLPYWVPQALLFYSVMMLKCHFWTLL